MKDSRYFQHDSNARNDSRLLKLRMKYGAKGYGIYFQIVEILREQSDFVCDLNLDTISYDLREKKEEIDDILRNFGLFVISRGKFYSPSLTKRMKTLEELRSRKEIAAKTAASVRWNGKKRGDENESRYRNLAGTV